MDIKVCTKCNTEKSVGEFYPRPNGKPCSVCKSCQRDTAKKRNAKNKEKWSILEPDRTGEKRCTDCKFFIAKIQFSVDRSKTDGLCSYCPDCDLKKREKTYLKTREKFQNNELKPVLFKRCPSCKDMLSAEAFGECLKNKDGLYVYCKDCVVEMNKDYLPYKRAALQKKRLNNREKWENSEPDKTGEKYCPRCKNLLPEEVFYTDRSRFDGLNYRCGKCCNEIETQRMMDNPAYKLRRRISGSIRTALKNQNLSKKGSQTWKHLPYTPQQLKEHLEGQFEDWMTWENHGPASNDKRTWQIDHIIPQHLLPYDDLEHPNFQKCWALENLRPLDAHENAKRTYEEFVLSYQEMSSR